MIVCNRCGKENQDHYKFCLGCGAELVAGPKPGGADVGMMKTMMADSSPGGGPPGARPLPGAPPLGPAPLGPPPMRPTAGMPGSSGSGPGMPPSGPLGGPPPPMGGAPMGPPMGPPPGVPSFSSGFPPPPMGGGPPPMGGMPPASATPGMRRCPSCGSDVPPGFRFCGSCGFRMDEASAPSPMPQPPQGGGMGMGMGPGPAARPQPRTLLTLIRPDGSEGGTHELRLGENKIGRNFGSIFENDGYLSPVHADLMITPPTALVRDLGSLNGVFVKMTGEEEVQPGQILRIGQELIRFELINPPEATADGTEIMGSPNPGYWGRLTVIIGNNVDGAAFPLLGENITLGRERGEINFPDDGYVSGLHARLTIRDGRVFLIDLGSSNGTFVKVNGERGLTNESYVLLGQQLFRLNML
jgi:pSer/pThr/pTyr-binding forkhead associated (FHA) protein